MSSIPLNPIVTLRRYLPAVLVLVLALASWGATPSVAAPALEAPSSPLPDDLKSLSLEELLSVKVVTATQVESDPFDLPFAVSAFTARDYEHTLPRNLPQWFSTVPGVMVQKTANGQASPFIRGFTGFRTLLLVDGIRLNNSTYRDGPNQYWNTVDPLSVERLELVKGPAAVLYGSDSIGGTANALTSGPPHDGRAASWHARALLRLSSAEASSLARAELAGPLGRQSQLFLGGTLKSFGDLRGGQSVGRQSHTGYDESDWDAKFEHLFAPNVRLTLAHQDVSQDDIWRTHSTIHGSHWRGLSSGTDRQRSLSQHRELTYAQLHATNLPGFVEELHVSLSNHLQDERQTRLRSDFRREEAETEVETFGANLQLQSPSPFGRWVYGANFYRDWVDSSTLRYQATGAFDRADLQGPVADDAIYDLAGLFVQNQLPPLGPVNFTVRGRYDCASVGSGRVLDPLTGQAATLSGRWHSFVGSGRASLRQGEHWQFFAGVAQGFRAPNLSDLSRLDTAASGQIETPSTQVSPECYLMSEVGAKARYDGLSFEATLFRTRIDGMIVRTPTGRTIDGLAEVTKRNSGDGFIEGVELQGRVPLTAGWSLSGAFTYLDGKLTIFPTSSATHQVREPVSRLMPVTTQLELRDAPTGKPYWFALACTLAARQTKLSSADLADTERIPPGGTPGYVTLTLRAGWQVNRHFSLDAAVENLTDTDYRIHGSGLNEPGRNLILSGAIQF